MRVLSVVKRGRLALAAAVVGLSLVAGLGVQQAEAEPVELSFLCASAWTGQIAYQPNGCGAGFYEIDLTAGEVTLCQSAYTGELRVMPPGGCSGGTQALTFGGEETVALCASPYTGKVRYSPSGACNPNEIELAALPGIVSANCQTDGDCPQPLPAVTGTSGAVSSEIVMSDPDDGQITDVNVLVDVSHAFIADLDVFLESPDGTSVELFTDIPCGFPVDLAVTLDDGASASITSQSCAAQITGTFQPEGSLAAFDDEPASGTWRLHVIDDAGLDGGLLWDWSLEITTDQGTLPAAACGDCVVLIPGTGVGGTEGVTVSQLPVSAPAGSQISDLDLTVDLAHTQLADLHIYLQSPAGTHVKVFQALCGDVDDLQVIFDDEAAGGLACGSRLGFNRFQPYGTLSAFDGEGVAGVWRLVAVDEAGDEAGGNFGTLTNWVLEFELS